MSFSMYVATWNRVTFRSNDQPKAILLMLNTPSHTCKGVACTLSQYEAGSLLARSYIHCDVYVLGATATAGSASG
jgi:hypothetical protein